VWRVAEAIADGTPVDWDRALAEAGTPAERDRLERIRQASAVWLTSPALPEGPGDEHPGGASVPVLELQQQIGRGGFGEVYRAWDHRLQRDVAIKLLRYGPDRTAHEQLQRVLREARALARIRHPNVLAVFSIETVGDRIGICTELVRGRTLAEIVQRDGPRSALDAAHLVAQLCRGLAAIHDAGLLHRDVKPQNVILADDGRVVLADLGGVRSAREFDAAGDLAGTPLWIAPELFAGGSASVQSDVYSTGVLLYFLTTRRLPYEVRTLSELTTWHESQQGPQPLGLTGAAGRRINAIVARAMAKRPEDRFASASEMERALTAAITSATRRVFAPLAGTLAAAALALTTIAAASPRHVPSGAASLEGRSGVRAHTSTPQDPLPSTASATAARLYAASQTAGMRSNWQEAAALVEQAIADDPTFAIAHAWRAWCLQVLGNHSDAVNAVSRATTLRASASVSERLFIDALHADLNGRTADAVSRYEGVLQIDADCFWAIQRLIVLSPPDPSRWNALLTRAADDKPSDYALNRYAAIGLMSAGDVAAARRYASNARAVEETAAMPRNPWLALLPAFDLWVSRDANGTAKELDAITAPNQTPPPILLAAAELDLALGRIAAAQALARRIPPSPMTEFIVAAARTNAASPRTLLHLPAATPLVQNWIWLMAENADPKEVESLVDAQRPRFPRQSAASPGIEALDGLVLWLKGRPKSAEILSRASSRMPGGTFQALMSADVAAAAAARFESLPQARRLLEAATARPAAAYGNGAALLAWVRARIRLAEYAEKDGDHERAKAVAAELSTLLAACDPDFEPARRLAALHLTP
jgi:serine/threonine-protein kinase